MIPAPDLSEVLVYAGSAASRYLDTVSKSDCFRIAPFGERAAAHSSGKRHSIAAVDIINSSISGPTRRIV